MQILCCRLCVLFLLNLTLTLMIKVLLGIVNISCVVDCIILGLDGVITSGSGSDTSRSIHK